MKLVSIPAGQYIIRKGTEADSFFAILRGEAQECIKLTLNESAEMSMGEKRGVQHCITVELTFLGKSDIAGEYLAAEKKAMLYPTDIRAMTDVNCLVLSTHVAGDELCMDLAIYFMRDEKLKKRERKQVERSMSRHRISITPGALSPAKPASTPSGEDSRKKSRKPSTALLPSLNGDDDDSEGPESARASEGRLGTQLVKKHWTVAEKGGLHLPMRPSSSITCAQISSSQMTPLTISSRLSLVTPITRSFHVSQRKLKPKKSIEERIKKIRESWPYQWHEDDDDGDGALTENEREALHTKRCTTFSRSRSPSRCDADSFGGRARSPSRAVSISAQGNLTVR
ncbi:Camp-dependent protein kinase regulatory subunit, partial [Globisporangium splendens]